MFTATSALCVALLIQGSSLDLKRRLAEPPPEINSAAVNIAFTTGVGRVEENMVLTLNPRIEVRGKLGTLKVGMPLYQRIGDNPPVQKRFGHDFKRHPASAIAALLSKLSISSEQFQLNAGHETTLSLGHGVLVDQHRASLDPTLPLSGARLTFSNGAQTAALSLGVDNLASPTLTALTLGFSPKAGFFEDFALSFELAGDLNAPLGVLSSAPQGIVWGSVVDVSYDVLRKPTWGVQLFMAAASLGLQGDAFQSLAPGFGGHLGFRLEMQSSKLRTSLQAQVIRSSGAYTPRYFDAAYSVERLIYQGDTKAARLSSMPSQNTTSALVDVHLEWGALRLRANMGLAPQANSTTLRELGLNIGVEKERLAVHVNTLWRNTRSAPQSFEDSLVHTAIDASFRIYGPLFAYSSFFSGFRQGKANKRRRVDGWIVGFGLSASTLARNNE